MRAHSKPYLRSIPRFLAPLWPACVLVCLAGCGTDRVVPTAVVPAPPQVMATTPAARSSGVVYDTPISVDFSTEMDASTLTAGNVFLKLDTQRVPSVLEWNAGARRLEIRPQALLRLQRTYTVELTSAVRSAEGTSIGDAGWFFQFTTNSTRRPAGARPRAGDADESPFVMLSWDSTETGGGSVSYEVWSGLDSAAIAVRAGTPTIISPRARLLPETRWPLGEKIFWAITVVNAATGERLRGPVQSLTTLPNGVAVDSVLVRGQDYGINYLIFSVSPIYPYQFCSSDSIWTVTNTQGWMTFPLSGLPADVRVASARLEVHTFNHYLPRLPTTTISVWSSKLDWPRPCRQNIQFRESLPIQDQLIATGSQESDRRIIFMSDLLASHVEASVRRGGFFGYEFVSSARIAYASPRILDASLHPFLKIHYFRTSPAPAWTKAP